MNLAIDSASSSPVIKLSGLCKVFHTEDIETHAVDHIDLEINKGEFVAITGPSGCGKSTMLSILGLIDTPSSGKYWLGGREVSTLDRVERATIRNEQIGFIFQAFNLINDLTVEENVELPLTYRRGIARTERRKRVAEALDRVGMGHRAQHYPGQLSGGQQQRVAVARALIGSPSILLADEPTGNLDSQNGESVMALLNDLHREGATICMVSHDPAFAERAGKVVRMLDGRVA